MESLPKDCPKEQPNDLKSFWRESILLSLVGNVTFTRSIPTRTWISSADLFANYFTKIKLSFAQLLSFLGRKFCMGTTKNSPPFLNLTLLDFFINGYFLNYS